MAEIKYRIEEKCDFCKGTGIGKHVVSFRELPADKQEQMRAEDDRNIILRLLFPLNGKGAWYKIDGPCYCCDGTGVSKISYTYKCGGMSE